MKRFKHVRLFENFDTINEKISDADIEKVKDAIKNNEFMQLRQPLKDIGFEVDFVTEPLPMYMAKKSGQKIAILNKKYAQGPDFVHGEIAMGIMESMTLTEAKKPSGATMAKKYEAKLKTLAKEMVDLAQEVKNERVKYEAGVKAVDDYVKKLRKEMNDKIAKSKANLKPYEDKLDRLNILQQQMLQELNAFEANTVKLGDIVVNVNKDVAIEKGQYNKDGTPKTTYSWKTIAELTETLVPISEENQRRLKEIKEENASQKLDVAGDSIDVFLKGEPLIVGVKDKPRGKGESVNEGAMSDVMSKIKDFYKKTIDSVSKLLSSGVKWLSGENAKLDKDIEKVEKIIAQK